MGNNTGRGLSLSRCIVHSWRTRFPILHFQPIAAFLGETFHHRAMGSARRWQNVHEERQRRKRYHHLYPPCSGRDRVGGIPVQQTPTAESDSHRQFSRQPDRNYDGQTASRPVLCLCRYRSKLSGPTASHVPIDGGLSPQCRPCEGSSIGRENGAGPTRWSRKDFDLRNQYLVKVINDVPNMIMDLILPSMFASPEHKFSDLIDIFKGMKFSLDHLYNELMAFDFDKVGLCPNLPFFIMHGDKDIITPTATAKAYFDKIEAPIKEYVRIRNAGLRLFLPARNNSWRNLLTGYVL